MTCRNHQSCGIVKTLITALFTFLFQTLSPIYAAVPVVAITQIINHPALNQQKEGIIVALKEAGYTLDQDISIISEDAQGSVGTATQIATKFAALKPTVAIGISTPSAQALVLPMQKVNIPLLYAAVSNPESAKLANAPNRVSGVSCQVSVVSQLKLIQQVLPTLKTIGVVHNPGEANAAQTVKEIQQEAKNLGMDVVVAAASKTSEVKSATDSLMGKVEAILLADDNTVASAIEAVIAVTKANKIPVFASDLHLIQKGAVAGLAVDHFELGKQAGRQVVRILKGEEVSAISAELPKDILLTGNKDIAVALGITLPDTVKWIDAERS